MLERNKVSPSLELAFKIAHVFGVAVEDIFVAEPDSEGVNPFRDGAFVEIRFEEPSGGIWIETATAKDCKKARHYQAQRCSDAASCTSDDACSSGFLQVPVK